MIDLSYHDEFAVLTLNRPEVLNALSFATLDRLEQRLNEVGDSAARCLVITGAGSKAFCAGADISELKGRTVEQVLDGTRRGQRVLSQLAAFRLPSIALVNGYALGGGCELALACTFRLATPGARFGLPEVKLGLVPGYGGTQRLTRLIGLSAALEVMMSGRLVDTEEALRIGLVGHILPDADALQASFAFGRRFTRWSLPALRFIRDAAALGADLPLAEGLEVEAYYSALSYQTDDGREGLGAFQAKRPAQFTDR